MPTPTETAQQTSFGQVARTTTIPDQTLVLDNLYVGRFSPKSPGPSNFFEGHIELAEQAVRETRNSFGKVAVFVGIQAGHHVLNPTGGNIVNPLVITNALPGEAILGTAIDGENVIARQLREPKGSGPVERAESAVAGGALGQEEGSAFFNVTRIRTVSDIIDYGINAVGGALGLKDNEKGDALSPKAAKLEKRLQQNPLNPEGTDTYFGNQSSQTPRDVYNITYTRDEISGASTEDIAKGFVPIQSAGSIQDDLSSDGMLRDNLDRAFESNAPLDKRNRFYTTENGVELVADADANASPIDNWKEPPSVQSSGMVFPFFFESLNSFSADHLEKFITFQATFKNLKESYQPSWESSVYFGRSSAIQVYQSTARSISFDFTIWAPNRISLGLVKQRMNWLARHCYPTYDKFGTTRIVKEAPVIKFTIGDLFRNTPGIITNLSYDYSGTRWELTKDLIMPQMIEVSIQITVLHDKFMQNATRAGVLSTDSNISSDFYEFIKPPLRGIGDQTDVSQITGNKIGKINGALTEEEMSGVVDQIIGGAKGLLGG